jgi:hypothetical protein
VKIRKFGLDFPRVDQLFKLVCEDLEKRQYFMDIGLTVEHCPIQFGTGVPMSKALAIPELGLYAAIFESENGSLNFLMAKVETKQVVMDGIAIYRGPHALLNDLFIGKDVTASVFPHISKSMFRFFVQNGTKPQYQRDAAVAEAVRVAYPDLEGLAGISITHTDFRE